MGLQALVGGEAGEANGLDLIADLVIHNGPRHGANGSGDSR